MIELTDEMRRVYADAWLRAVAPKLEDPVVERMVAEEVAEPMPWRQAALAAVLAIVERDVLQPAVDRAEYAGHERGWRERGEKDADRCPERRGHVWHPLAKALSPAWATGRGGSHPHYCASCSEDGRTPGPGCLNCRSTGYDQSPWPDCEQCRFARRAATP